MDILKNQWRSTGGNHVYLHKFECDLIKFLTLCVFLLYLSSILFFLSDLGSVSSGSEYRWIDLFTTTSSYKRNHPRALQSFQNANLCKDERNFEKRFLCMVKVLIIEFHIKCFLMRIVDLNISHHLERLE